MYLKFAQINIWPSREVITKPMPDVFKDKYPSTRVSIDCTEIKCEMPSTVNSRYTGHPRDRDLVCVIARVRNSGVRENF